MAGRKISQEILDGVGRMSSLCLSFNENLYDEFVKLFHDVPAVWPISPQYLLDETDTVTIEQSKNEVGFWGLPEHRNNLRLILTGLGRNELVVDWYYASAVLIPSQSAWDCSAFEKDLVLIKDHHWTRADDYWPNKTLAAFLKLTNTFGWCGMQHYREDLNWWIMFKESLAPKVDQYYDLVKPSSDRAICRYSPQKELSLIE